MSTKGVGQAHHRAKKRQRDTVGHERKSQHRGNGGCQELKRKTTRRNPSRCKPEECPPEEFASAGFLAYECPHMSDTYDVIVIGGAFSGAATALLLRRECPELRVAIIERSTAFDRKVGEATTEVSGNFLTKRLSLTSHLNHHHINKQGLRFWFTDRDNEDFGRCKEMGAYYQVRMPSYQVDREVLDQHVLDEAVAAGAELLRPAKVVAFETEKSVTVEHDGLRRELRTRWIVDASGRASVLPRKLGFFRPLPAHPTNSIWARFRGVKDLDGYDLRSRFPEFAAACQASRSAATNHLAGRGWWCWIIPLKGGDTSVGLVYDERLFTPPEGPCLADRLKTHLLSNPVGRELFSDAEAVEGDVKAYSALPYFTEKIAGPGWQVVGDAAGFLDPLYSAGLDYCSWTASAAVYRIRAEHSGEIVDLEDMNARFQRSYHGWFESLYLEKYRYLGDAELMYPAFLMDLGLFFFGPVRTLCQCSEAGFSRFPFDGPVDGAVCKFMAFYNRRLATIADRKFAAGTFGDRNLDGRLIVRGFEPTPKALRMVVKGIRLWLVAEWRARGLHPKPILSASTPHPTVAHAH